MAREASEKQMRWIRTCLEERQVPAEMSDGLRKIVAEHDAEISEPGTGKLISLSYASSILDILFDLPKKPREGERQDGSAAKPGVYRKDGRIFIVREFTPRGENRKVQYARELVPLSSGQSDRLDGGGEHVRYEEIKAPRMQYQLSDAEVVPLADVKKLSIQFGYCIVCGTQIVAAESVERGIGPVCAKRQQALLLVSA